MALLAIMLMQKGKYTRRDFTAPLIFSTTGFLYAVWALFGAGAEIVMWGILLLMLGLPVYVWQIKERYETEN